MPIQIFYLQEKTCMGEKMKIDPQCEICCQKPESIGHLLWECPLARNVWALCRGKIQKCSNAEQDFFALFMMMANRLTQMELGQMGNDIVGIMEC